MFAATHLVTNHDDLWAALIAGGVAIGIAAMRGRQVKRTLGEPNGAGTIANMILAVHDEARVARVEATAAARAAAQATEVAATAVRDHTERDEQRFNEVDARFDALRDETARQVAALRTEMSDGFTSLGQIIDGALGVRPKQ